MASAPAQPAPPPAAGSALFLTICLLPVGAHYGGYLLAPLKAQFASERDFAAVVAATQLLNTISPLLAMVLISRSGLARSAICTVAVVAVGMALAVVADSATPFGLQVVGFLIFGFGVSPIAIIQEALLVRHFASRSPGLVGLGLLAGKMASWLASVTAVPLAEAFEAHTPFRLALSLCIVSVAAALGTRRLEGTDPPGTPRTTNPFADVVAWGDAFWLYLLLCATSGALWFPFIHLSPTFIDRLFPGHSHRTSANIASLSLLAPLVLYPLVGHLLRKRTSTALVAAFALASLLTGASVVILVSNGASRSHMTAVEAIVPFALGRGYAPLLLVLLVTRVVGPKHTSYALALHKCLEQAGASLSQIVAGEILAATGGVRGLKAVLSFLLAADVAQFIVIVALGLYLQLREPRRGREERLPLLDEGQTSRPSRLARLWLTLAGLTVAASCIAFVVTRFSHDSLTQLVQCDNSKPRTTVLEHIQETRTQLPLIILSCPPRLPGRRP